MHKITYTFAADCKIPQLRGMTVTRGEFCRADGKWQQEPDAVRFFERIDGKTLIVMISGKPELEAAFASHKAAKQAIIDRLAEIGWPQYQAVQRRAYNARAAYDKASDRGYPIREARIMDAADQSLAVAREQYPMAAAYAKAESYSMAHNDEKSSAGRNAMIKIEAGINPIAAVIEMENEWQAAAQKLVMAA